MKVTRLVSVCLLLLLIFSICSGCVLQSPPAPSASPQPTETVPSPAAPSPSPTPEPPQPGLHTLRLAADALPRCWNVHSWESEADSLIWRLTVSPLVDLGLAPDGNGGTMNAWIFEMAESVEDITAAWPQSADWGISPEETGRVWRIRLRQGACWDDGKETPIDADAYLASMKLLLSREMMNYRASAFCEGPVAIAGANAYRFSGADYWEENALTGGGFACPPEEWTLDNAGRYRGADGTELCFSLRSPLRVWLDGSSLEDYYRAGYVTEDIYNRLLALGDEEGFVPVTPESEDLLYAFTGSDDWGRESREDLAYYTVCRRTWPETEWSRVGLLREDDHTLIYVCAESVGEFDFLFGLTNPWLVYEPAYESGKFTYEDRVYTGYATSPETTVSCGPYRLKEASPSRMLLERNDTWFGYRDGSAGGLYAADRIELRAARPAEAAELFSAGELDVYVPSSGAGIPEGTDSAVCWRDDAYTYRFFMATDPETLQRLQEAASTDSEKVNKTCLANAAFREALSWALDRSRFAALAEEPRRPALGLIGDLYYCSVEADLNSRYRDSVPGMAALSGAYSGGVGADADPLALRGFLRNCTGYDPSRARRLFQTACEQMLADGSWTDDMVIRLDCAVGTKVTEAQQRQNELLQQLLEEAAAGTDLEGRIFIRFCADPNRYAAVSSGSLEMGFGAWGGAAFDPFSLMQCYCDPVFNTVQEGCGFDPAARLLSLTVGGESLTATYTEWCRSILPGGSLAGDPARRLEVLAGLEEALLREHRMIVAAVGTQPVCFSGKVRPGSERYSILSGFGGIRSLRFLADDAEWAARG